jgi:hypothetical protein
MAERPRSGQMLLCRLLSSRDGIRNYVDPLFGAGAEGVDVKSWVPRGTCPAYFCLLVPRVQATVSHNHEED